MSELSDYLGFLVYGRVTSYGSTFSREISRPDWERKLRGLLQLMAHQSEYCCQLQRCQLSDYVGFLVHGRVSAVVTGGHSSPRDHSPKRERGLVVYCKSWRVRSPPTARVALAFFFIFFRV